MMRRTVALNTRRERLDMPDGDFIDLDWVGEGAAANQPIVIVIPGLQGSICSPYARGLLRAVVERGWRGVLMHFRGCSGEPNRLPRSYHSGDTADLTHLVEVIRRRCPDAPVAAVGYSLGGNVLLKWLGESGEGNPLHAAAAVSVPFDLARVADRMERGFSRVYQHRLLREMIAALRHKMRRIDLGLPLGPDDLPTLNTFRRFDDRVTAPLHGFVDADDYYTRCSCRQYLPGIRRPTLIVHALDDPFMRPDVAPNPPQLPPCVRLELSSCGGHVGFVAGNVPWKPTYWLEQRIPQFLSRHLTVEI